VALTLRLLCGLSTAEVARAFLVSKPTMAARITRAKKKIAVARIPYRVPPAAELPERIDAVLSVVHLLFTTGHTVPTGDELVRRDLVERSLQLCRMLRRLLPRDPAVAGLLALLLLTDARGRPAPRRTGGCSCSRSRTVRSGTAQRSTRDCPWSARPCAPGHPRATRCRRRSPPCTPSRPLAGHRLA
jgi:predicted RNA polymerase sigma factor